MEDVTDQKISKAGKLNRIAARRNQTLAEMAIAWLLKDSRITSVLIGVSSAAQLEDNLKSLDNLVFTQDELQEIEIILME